MTENHAAGVYVTEAEVHTVLTACRVLAAVAARSVEAGQRVDPGDLRVLLIIADRQPLGAADLVTAAQTNPVALRSAVRRLTAAGMIASAPDDPSQGILAVSADGHRMIAEVLARRRQAMELIARRLPALRRLELMAMLGGDANVEFRPAAGRDAGAATAIG